MIALQSRHRDIRKLLFLLSEFGIEGDIFLNG
jgi:hypothetical protein